MGWKQEWEAETVKYKQAERARRACSGLTLPDDVEEGAVKEALVLAAELLEALDFDIAPVNAGYEIRLNNALRKLGITP